MTKQERSARTRRELIRSAAEAFDQYGYIQARMAGISSEAGVSSGALHFHFENKAALAAAVEAEAALALRGAARSASLTGRNALQVLTDTSHELADLLRSDVTARAGFQLSCDGAKGPGLSLRQEWQSCVQQLLSQAALEGVLAPGASQQSLAAAIVAATTGFEVLGRTNREWLSRSALTGFWQLLHPVLATPEALAGLNPAGTPDLSVDFAANAPADIPHQSAVTSRPAVRTAVRPVGALV
ncbi:AcrR family transcriptional regulator [Kitasatospora sp. MAP12-15]|uniref:ScbR family autoregulator-binding transcription factor n=1 Tax=unclassified Kitasatospora TaxID=2633591 RepID=UPI002473FE1D|nr:ScbR family autoregulator-binding transcription factor [Kitasatospora sp. MAP12-44]MDH6112143.1 AcrR family transcriptional regulator [Kitasatospora sp. MAP12-44]